jgi:hypothetical protein
VEAIILGIYGFFVWLIFIKFKWLPWNITSQVIVAIIPIVGHAGADLTLNVVAPSSTKLRVFKYTVPIVSQVRGACWRFPSRKAIGSCGRRACSSASTRCPISSSSTAFRRSSPPRSGQRELFESQKGANARTAETRRRDPARRRRESPKSRPGWTSRAGASPRRASSPLPAQAIDSISSRRDQSRRDRGPARQRAGAARASARDRSAGDRVGAQVGQKLGAQVDGQFAQVAQIRRQLENAEVEPRPDGHALAVRLLTSSTAVAARRLRRGLPLNPVMTLVEADGQIVAFYAQNELTKVQAGDEAEFALQTYPGRIIKGKVDSIIWAMGQGQLPASGTIPMSTLANQPPGVFAVKFDLAPRERELFLAAGAVGDAAIYTQHLAVIQIIRKVILRVGSYTNYLILKLH